MPHKINVIPIYASFYVPFLSLNNSYPNTRMLSSAGPGSVILQSGRVGYSPVECPVSTTLFLGFGFVIQYVWLKCQVKFQFQALLTGLLVLNMLLSHKVKAKAKLACPIYSNLHLYSTHDFVRFIIFIHAQIF